MKHFVILILFVFLIVRINCLQLKKCVHDNTVLTSLQNDLVTVGCEFIQPLSGCILRKSDSSNKYCSYRYGASPTWSWKRINCPPEAISSTWISYENCEFVISNPSVTGNQLNCNEFELIKILFFSLINEQHKYFFESRYRLLDN